MNIEIIDNRIGSIWPLPGYDKQLDRFLELRACIDHSILLQPNEIMQIFAGIAYKPELNYYQLLITSIKNLKHKIIAFDSTTRLDKHHGLVYTTLWNNDIDEYQINPGDVIAHGVFVTINKPLFNVLNKDKVCSNIV